MQRKILDFDSRPIPPLEMLAQTVRVETVNSIGGWIEPGGVPLMACLMGGSDGREYFANFNLKEWKWEEEPRLAVVEWKGDEAGLPVFVRGYDDDGDEWTLT